MRDDLIRRSDAIGAITNHCENECYYRIDSWCPQCQREEFQEAIKAVPSADRLQGEWKIEYHGNGWNDYWDYTCSNCGKKYERADAVLYKANFCPNCGARMKGEVNEM